MPRQWELRFKKQVTLNEMHERGGRKVWGKPGRTGVNMLWDPRRWPWRAGCRWAETQPHRTDAFVSSQSRSRAVQRPHPSLSSQRPQSEQRVPAGAEKGPVTEALKRKEFPTFTCPLCVP